MLNLVIADDIQGHYYKNRQGFTNFEDAILNDEIFTYILGFINFIIILKVIKLFRFNRKVCLGFTQGLELLKGEKAMLYLHCF